MLSLQIDVFERVVDSDIRHESDNDLEESDGNAHAPSNTMQVMQWVFIYFLH